VRSSYAVFTQFLRNGINKKAAVFTGNSGAHREQLVPERGWKATPLEIPLICTARSKEIVCNGKYSLNGEPAVMTIAREK